MTTVQRSNVATFPAIKPGYRLAPVAIGSPDGPQRIAYLECPTFCVIDHLNEPVTFLEDVSHSGVNHTAYIYSFLGDALPTYTLSAGVSIDPMSSDPALQAAHIVVSDEGSADAYLTAEMADSAAVELEMVAAKLREAARTVRLYNANGDSDLNMDEALRRVNGGAA